MVSLFPPPCPQLPEFQSLVVRGSFHASAPIHLLLSHTIDNPEARAVFLTPRRDFLKNALVELNEQWISQHSGTGKHCAAAQRTQIYYPPTLAHLRFILSTLHEYDDTLHHAKTTLESAPTLLVLHDVSAYFTAQASEATVSAYLSVVSSALALTASWSPRSQTTSRLVLFDSGLSALKLPILRSLSFDEAGDAEARRRDTLSVLLERYFEWRAEFQEEPEPNSEDDMETEEEGEAREPESRTMRLHRIARHGQMMEGGNLEDEEADIVWTWTESVQTSQDGLVRTLLLWDQ